MRFLFFLNTYIPVLLYENVHFYGARGSFRETLHSALLTPIEYFSLHISAEFVETGPCNSTVK